jgi:hypothetical protein
MRLLDDPENQMYLDQLERMGRPRPSTDDEFVGAFARLTHFSPDAARQILAGDDPDDVVTLAS